jgi:GR25 family glycosyltransferase involved in LPS biosynthesis
MEIRTDEELINELYELRREHNVKEGLKKVVKYKLKLENNQELKYPFYEILAFFLYYNDHIADSLNVYKKLHYYCPNQRMLDACDFNIHFSATQMADIYITYNKANVDWWTKFFARERKGEQLITITTTTCKRLDLFKPTMNSFLACCLDFDKFEIDKWLVVDDNSSQEDRDEMARLYPFLTFINKTPAQKGHARSINMMLRHVHTPYLFHLEDDWQFYHKDNFFTLLYEIIQEKDEYKQVLLNNMYGELPEHEQLIGGHWHRTESSGLNYIVHEYTSTREEQDAFNRKWQFKPNCSYWPHFSFRPGLSKVDFFRELGDFNEDVWHFERNYADKYVDKGYKTLFLPGMVCKHIGKLTSDREGTNAYILNGEYQFYGEKKITFMKRLATYCVNLERRHDRRLLFEKTMIDTSLPITMFPAVDGYALDMTPQMYHLFDKNDYNYRKGIVGCALSHIKIWIQHYYSEISKQRDFLMVMEDDLYFAKGNSSGFEDVVEESMEYMEKQDLDLLFLQYTPRNKDDVSDSVVKYRRVNTRQALDFSYGGTGCYIITNKGIEKMIQFINEYGMTNAIDTVMQKSADHLNVAYLEPLLVVLDMNKEGDTDIQFNFESCARDIISLIQDEVRFLIKLGEKDYTISKFEKEGDYTYKLDSAFVVVNNPSDKLRQLRPNQRLIGCDGKFTI